ncbi:MAG: hypothetical protein KKC46_05900 [Proteobacteria bacterium]|nr:hypothetical protein [Pseudomonadota bacterium]
MGIYSYRFLPIICYTQLSIDLRARDYLNKRGITDNALFADYKTGFANGSLLNVLPEEVKEQLKEIGILNNRGMEHFYSYVTFPVYDSDGNPSGICGRRVEGMSQGADHLYLPGERRGMFNRQAAKSHKDIILTESIIDAQRTQDHC